MLTDSVSATCRMHCLEAVVHNNDESGLLKALSNLKRSDQTTHWYCLLMFLWNIKHHNEHQADHFVELAEECPSGNVGDIFNFLADQSIYYFLANDQDMVEEIMDHVQFDDVKAMEGDTTYEAKIDILYDIIGYRKFNYEIDLLDHLDEAYERLPDQFQSTPWAVAYGSFALSIMEYSDVTKDMLNQPSKYDVLAKADRYLRLVLQNMKDSQIVAGARRCYSVVLGYI